MKIKMKKTPGTLLLTSMVAVLAFTVACEKDDNDGPNPPAGSGKVALLNAAFGTDSVNFYGGAEKMNSKLIGDGDSLKYNSVEVGHRACEHRGRGVKLLV